MNDLSNSLAAALGTMLLAAVLWAGVHLVADMVHEINRAGFDGAQLF